MADRFVRGEEVPYSTLRQVWRDTTQPSGAADLPTHEEFFRGVRAVNESLPRERQLRVLLGDPPIDWGAIRSASDHFKWIEMRDAYPAALIHVEVLAKQHRALIVYGTGHLQRKNALTNFDMEHWQAQTIVSLLERSGPTKIFTVWGFAALAELQTDVRSWQTPRLALVRGTTLGSVDAGRYFSWGTRFQVRDGTMAPVPRDQWRSMPAEEQFDAVLYLGPPSAMTETRLDRKLCSEPGYLEFRLKRIVIAGIPQAEADWLKQQCAGASVK